WQIARGARETLIDRTVDDQHRGPAERIEPRAQGLGLGVVEASLFEDHQLAFGLLCRERGLQDEPAHLFLQIEFVAAHDGPEVHRAAAELRRAQAALTSAAGAL